ncbi:SpoIID/LytB domain-containing protein [Flavonifractor plautii]|nr:SpoIID/LytB domain-containing protein [Flavonifractor plautii]
MKQRVKGNILRLVTACLAILLISGLAPAGAASVEANPMVRVGLFYGGNALSGANLANDVGSGYRFGYFDSDLTFQLLGYTSETTVSMVKTQNVYYGSNVDWSGSGYYDSKTSDIAVGCYHLQLPQTYATFEEASAAAAQYSDGFPAWIDGTYYVRVGSFLDSASAQAAQASLGLTGATVAGTSGAGISVVKTGTNTVLFQFDSTSGLYLAVKPDRDDTVKAETYFRGYSYFGAFEYRRNGGDITVVNVLSMDDYLQGVIVQEMSPSWPLEALKAQTVCARSYAYGKLQAGKHQSQGFDLCNTTDCQAYVGIATASDNSRRAVEETSGVYLWYNGRVADQAVYSSHNGGASESAVNVWGRDYPYLIGKIDPYEASVVDRISNYNWTVTYTAQELTELLQSKGYGNSTIVDFRVTKTSPTGNAIEITFTDANGRSWSKTREACRTFLGLRSQHYTISGGSGGGYAVNGTGSLSTLNGAYAVDGSGAVSTLTEGQVYAIGGDGVTSQVKPSASAGSSGVFTITGSGWGHGVGMSQWGAYAMAQQGDTYKDILTFYYTGIEVRKP